MEDQIRQYRSRAPHHGRLLASTWSLLVINVLLCTPRWTVTVPPESLRPCIQSTSNALQLGENRKGFLGEAAFEKGQGVPQVEMNWEGTPGKGRHASKGLEVGKPWAFTQSLCIH